MQDDPSGSAMIALLPITTSWCNIELPHMTLVFAGLLSDLKSTAFNEMAKDAASIAMISNPVTLRVTGVEVFGDVEKVDVLRLQPSSQLLAMRRMVEKWNASDFPFKPHATIGPVGSLNGMMPNFLAFDRIAVGWGSELLTFWLTQKGLSTASPG